jgi:hypothetical protein
MIGSMRGVRQRNVHFGPIVDTSYVSTVLQGDDDMPLVLDRTTGEEGCQYIG